MRGRLLLTLALALGCAPQTTLRVQAHPLPPAPDRATVVLVYPAVSDAGRLHMPLLQPDGRGVWFRFTSGDRRVLADLDANTYAVVYLRPGEHSIVASNWAPGEGAMLVAVLDARVSAGRVYVVNLTFDAQRVALVPVAPTRVLAALSQLPRSQRLTLDPARGVNLFLDSALRAELVDSAAASVRQHAGVTTLFD